MYSLDHLLPDQPGGLPESQIPGPHWTQSEFPVATVESLEPVLSMNAQIIRIHWKVWEAGREHKKQS